MSLVDRAIAKKKLELREQKRSAGRPYDEIWCVFDVDDHADLQGAIGRADQHGIKVAVSHPCIELWFILHFEDQTAYIERQHAQSRSKTLLGCKKLLTEQALLELAGRHEEAARRAKKLDRKHEGDGSPPRSNPSSEVWQVVEQIKHPPNVVS
jgi:hypothetical protein